MLFTISSNKLAVLAAKAASMTNPKVDHLRDVWMNASDACVSLTATDSAIEFCGSIGAVVSSEGVAGVAGKQFAELVKKLPAGDVTISLVDNVLQLKQGRRSYKLPTASCEPFSVTRSIGGWVGNVPSTALRDSLGRVLHCVHDDKHEAMEAITCVRIQAKAVGDVRAVEFSGLNGHQYAMHLNPLDALHNTIALSNSDKNEVLLRKSYVHALMRHLPDCEEIEVSMDEKRLYVSSTDQREHLSIPLSNYTYPDTNAFVRKVVEGVHPSITVDRVELIGVLERLSMFINKSNEAVSLMVQEGELHLSSKGDGLGGGFEAISCACKDVVPHVCFSIAPLLDILGRYESKEIQLVITGAETPCGVVGQGDNGYLTIMMPMKVVDEVYEEAAA